MSRKNRRTQHRGVMRWNAKLNEERVREARTCYYQNPEITLQELAWRYGVSLTTIQAAILGRTWSHVE